MPVPRWLRRTVTSLVSCKCSYDNSLWYKALHLAVWPYDRPQFALMRFA